MPGKNAATLMFVTGSLLEPMNPDEESVMQIDDGGRQKVEAQKPTEWFPNCRLNKGCKIIASVGNPGRVIAWDCDDTVPFENDQNGQTANATPK